MEAINNAQIIGQVLANLIIVLMAAIRISTRLARVETDVKHILFNAEMRRRKYEVPET